MKTRGRISAHVTNPGRLCTVLTRAKDGLIVICRGSTIATTRQTPRQTSEKNTISDMYFNAIDRGLVVRDRRTWANTTEYLELTARWDQQRKDRHARQVEIDRDSYLNKAKGYYRDTRAWEASHRGVTTAVGPMYHTAHTVSEQAPLGISFDPTNPGEVQRGVEYYPSTGPGRAGQKRRME